MEYRTKPSPDPTRAAFLDYRKIREMRDQYLEPGFGVKPEKFLVRSDHFLRMFNEDFKLKGDKAVSRRTLQFYSSPQLRLFPLPKYLNRHTAYYLFPDHYELLGAIWTMRSKLFMPIDMIRAILKVTDRDLYRMIMDWDESPEALIDAVMMDKADYEPEEFHLYRASKDLMTEALIHSLVRHNTEAEVKRAMVHELTEKYVKIRDWIESGRAGKFVAALAKGRREFTDIYERLEQMASEKGAEAGDISAEKS